MGFGNECCHILGPSPKKSVNEKMFPGGSLGGVMVQSRKGVLDV